MSRYLIRPRDPKVVPLVDIEGCAPLTVVLVAEAAEVKRKVVYILAHIIALRTVVEAMIELVTENRHGYVVDEDHPRRPRVDGVLHLHGFVALAEADEHDLPAHLLGVSERTTRESRFGVHCRGEGEIMIAVCRIAQPWIDVEASNQAAQMRPVRSLRPPDVDGPDLHRADVEAYERPQTIVWIAV